MIPYRTEKIGFFRKIFRFYFPGLSLPGTIYLFLIAGLAMGCDFKLPSPPPKLFYKFNVLDVGQGPSYLVSKDLNLDGAIDIISANSKGNTITILYGRADGTFLSPVHINTYREPSALAVDDINRDGALDIILNSRGDHYFLVLLGKGNNRFFPVRRYPTGRVPLYVIVDDYNNDGNLDVAVSLTFAKLEIYLGVGDGSFKKGDTLQMRTRSFSGISGDFNNDGNQDIALAGSSSNSSSIMIYNGLGDGSFRAPYSIAEGLRPLTLIKTDMNSDQIDDLMIASASGDILYMLFGNGDGSFKKEISFSGGGGPISMTTGHFNEDKLLDVAVANSRSSSFSIVIRKPDGLFKYPTRDYVTGGTPIAITSGDYNDDGLTDIAVASNADNTVEIFLQRRVFK